jgi:hypothetical protein
MAKFTIAVAKKALALAYPDIEFSYGKSGRGRDAGPCVSWVGGPDADTIRSAAGAPAGSYWGRAPYHFIRQDTPEEREVKYAQWDAQRRAQIAAEPARRAAAKAAGIAKRAETLAAKKIMLAKMYGAFPVTEFHVSTLQHGGLSVAWVDGPEVAEVASVLTINEWQCHRSESAEFRATKAERDAAKVQAGRLAKRLAYSRVRAIRVAKGIERRRYACCVHLGRKHVNVDQFVLPLDLPIWPAPWVHAGVAA